MLLDGRKRGREGGKEEEGEEGGRNHVRGVEWREKGGRERIGIGGEVEGWYTREKGREGGREGGRKGDNREDG